MSARRRKWIVRLIVVLVLLGAAAGVRAWRESPGYRARDLMDRLCDDQPGIIRQVLIKIGLTKTHSKLPEVAVYAELLVIGRPAVPALIEATRDPRPRVRSTAAWALGDLAEGTELDNVVVLLKDQNEWVRFKAADALGKARYARAVEPLCELLEGNRAANESPEWAAVNALVDIGDKRAVGRLIASLQPRRPNPDGSPGFDPRGWFLGGPIRARRLGGLGGPEVRAFLLESLKTISDDQMAREGAAEALGEMRDDEAVVQLAAMLDEFEVGWFALRSLGRTGNTKAADVLAGQLAREKSSEWGLEAAAGLYRLGDARGREKLMAALTSSDRSASIYAAGILAELGDRAAYEPLLRLMNGKDTRASGTAGNWVRAYGQPSIVTGGTSGMSDTAEIRTFCVCALGRLGDMRAVGPLIAALEDENRYVRLAAAFWLGQLGARQAAGPLTRHIDDKDLNVVTQVAEALGKLRADEAAGPLERRLREIDATDANAGFDAIVAIAKAYRAIKDGLPPPAP